MTIKLRANGHPGEHELAVGWIGKLVLGLLLTATPASIAQGLLLWRQTAVLQERLEAVCTAQRQLDQRVYDLHRLCASYVRDAQ